MTHSIAQAHEVQIPEPQQSISRAVEPTIENLKIAGAHEYFHTFAALSSQKKNPPAISITSPEAFVDLLFDNLSSEPDGFILWSTLEQLVEGLLS